MHVLFNKLVVNSAHGTHVTFDLSAQPDCTEVWHSERRGAEGLDRRRHWLYHRPRLPERPEEWSHSVRVSGDHRSSITLHHGGLDDPFLLCTVVWKNVIFSSVLSAFFFLTDSSTSWPQALWKRSTTQLWTGIRWVDDILFNQLKGRQN